MLIHMGWARPAEVTLLQVYSVQTRYSSQSSHSKGKDGSKNCSGYRLSQDSNKNVYFSYQHNKCMTTKFTTFRACLVGRKMKRVDWLNVFQINLFFLKFKKNDSLQKKNLRKIFSKLPSNLSLPTTPYQSPTHPLPTFKLRWLICA